MVCIWDLRVPTKVEESDLTGIMRPVVKIAAAHGEEKVGRGQTKAKSLARSVTGLLYAVGYPYGLVSSGSFDG
jgi:hypothetical protein